VLIADPRTVKLKLRNTSNDKGIIVMRTSYPNTEEQDFYSNWINDWMLMVIFCTFGGLIGVLSGELTLFEAMAGSVTIGSLFYGLVALSLWVENK